MIEMVFFIIFPSLAVLLLAFNLYLDHKSMKPEPPNARWARGEKPLFFLALQSGVDYTDNSLRESQSYRDYYHPRM